MASIIRICGESRTSLSDAVTQGISSAVRSMRHLQGAQVSVDDLQAEFPEPGCYRVSMRISVRPPLPEA